MNAVEIRGLTKRFGDLQALAGVDLHVAPGEVLGLLGPNGAGKSTLVRALVGRVRPDHGEIELLGRPADDPGARAALGYVPQEIALYGVLTAEQNLLFFGRLLSLAGAPLRSAVAAALAFSKLEDRAGDPVEAFSGGMKRRLNLAAAVLHDPEIVLLDEPTVGVDPQSRGLIFDNVLALRDRGRTIVYATHYMEEAERLCDRVAIVDHGRLLALDTVDSLVAANGGEGPSFRVERARLEDVFLRLTGRHSRD